MIKVEERGGFTRKFLGQFTIVVSTNGVLTIRNRRGETIKAYPEGAWLDAEKL